LSGENTKRVPADSLSYPGDGRQYLDDEPFTGVAYYLDDQGQLVGEIEYRNGLEWGLKREWYAPDEPYYEGNFFMGVLHGRKREWHDNGQLAEDGDYEYGFALRRKKWDEDGDLEEEYELKESDSDYTRLEKFREIYKEKAAKEKPPQQPGSP
jgi:antitoxin component YwqK of YwqJK toxin-antitoxin module